MNGHTFLVVEDNAALARGIVRVLTEYGSAMAVGTVCAATEVLAKYRDLSALVVDVGLPDGSGLDVLTQFRSAYPSRPSLVLSGSPEPRAINRAFDLNAAYVVKPFEPARLRQFVATNLPAPNADSGATPPPVHSVPMAKDPIAENLNQLVERHGLTPAESDLLDACMHGLSGKEYFNIRNISPNTYKMRVRRALRKLHCSSLGEVRDRLLRLL